MLKPRVEKILNEQVQKEGYSSFLYLAMASWSENKGMPGTAQWFYAQAQEELMHMLKFVAYINERGGKAIIPALDQAPTEWQDVYIAFAEVLKHEEFISDSINKIVEVSISENDFATTNWLQWFVNEQILEESSVKIVIDKLNLFGKDTGNLYLFDRDIMTLRTSGQ